MFRRNAGAVVALFLVLEAREAGFFSLLSDYLGLSGSFNVVDIRIAARPLLSARLSTGPKR